MSHVFKLFFRGQQSSTQTAVPEKLENIKDMAMDHESTGPYSPAEKMGKMPGASDSYKP